MREIETINIKKVMILIKARHFESIVDKHLAQL